jgi:hypothetical protein
VDPSTPEIAGLALIRPDGKQKGATVTHRALCPAYLTLPCHTMNRGDPGCPAAVRQLPEGSRRLGGSRSWRMIAADRHVGGKPSPRSRQPGNVSSAVFLPTRPNHTTNTTGCCITIAIYYEKSDATKEIGSLPAGPRVDRRATTRQGKDRRTDRRTGKTSNRGLVEGERTH